MFSFSTVKLALSACAPETSSFHTTTVIKSCSEPRLFIFSERREDLHF